MLLPTMTLGPVAGILQLWRFASDTTSPEVGMLYRDHRRVALDRRVDAEIKRYELRTARLLRDAGEQEAPGPGLRSALPSEARSGH
jgi:hypothetical protein